MTWTEACRIGPALVARYCAAGMPQVATIDAEQFQKAKAVEQQVAYHRRRHNTGRPGYWRTHKIGPGERPLIAWVKEVAEHDGVKPHTIYQRVYRGSYPDHKFRRINKRVVFVTPPSV